MAFRIHESVVRGEIDNRTKGKIRGKIWLVNRDEPVVLELVGNAAADLAGCLLTFINPLKLYPHQHLDKLCSLQKGSIGDLTASRKVRVFDVPPEEAMDMIRRKEKLPEHMANCLYLEWFSETNGRVVVESADYQLTISAPEWRLTPLDEAQRARDAHAGMGGFLEKLTNAIDTQKQGQKDAEEPWDEHDYEKFMKESDARTEKYGELLDKYGTGEEARELIEKEMGWGKEFEPDEDAPDNPDRMSIEEMNAIYEAAMEEADLEPEPDPAREGIDWVRDESGELHHPLQHQCANYAFAYFDLLREEEVDPGVSQFAQEFQITSAKLAGALSVVARGEEFMDPAFTVACLKRALSHLHEAQSGLETAAAKSALPVDTVVKARRELFEIREGILKLMDEYRGRS